MSEAPELFIEAAGKFTGDETERLATDGLEHLLLCLSMNMIPLSTARSMLTLDKDRFGWPTYAPRAPHVTLEIVVLTCPPGAAILNRHPGANLGGPVQDSLPPGCLLRPVWDGGHARAGKHQGVPT